MEQSDRTNLGPETPMLPPVDSRIIWSRCGGLSHPKKLVFHYTKLSKLQLILDSGRIRFGDLCNTNDPYEKGCGTWTSLSPGAR